MVLGEGWLYTVEEMSGQSDLTPYMCVEIIADGILGIYRCLAS